MRFAKEASRVSRLAGKAKALRGKDAGGGLGAKAATGPNTIATKDLLAPAEDGRLVLAMRRVIDLAIVRPTSRAVVLVAASLAACVVPAPTGTARAVPQPVPTAAAFVGMPGIGPMGIASRGTDLRGQRDTIGFASTAQQMARTWELSATGPAPDVLGQSPPPPVFGVISPHDDYLYAGRVYREVLPLLRAKTVVVVGVFHKYRKFGVHDVIVFDPFRAWRTPDGEVRVSALREQVRSALSDADALTDARMHEAEHSVEALVYWLRHARPDVEILPVIVPAAGQARLRELADRLAGALGAAMREHGLQPGSDVAVAISADAVHYGPDFKHVPFGDGGVEAYVKAVARDKALLTGPLAGPITDAKAAELYATFVDPQEPDTYRVTWCGRFSVPFGLWLMRSMANRLGAGEVRGHPVAYATSVGWPELAVREVGLGETAPANLYHFVGYPAVAFTITQP